MAEGTVQLPPNSTGAKLRTQELTVGSNLVEQEVITVARSNGVFAGEGTWSYASGTLSSAGTVTGVGRCTGISVFANGTDSTFNINGGDTITVRNGAGKDIDPGENLTAPVVNWVSGVIDVFIQGLA